MDDIITPVFVIAEFTPKKIREEEQFQKKKHHRELNQDNDPKFFSNGHLPETLVIEGEKLF